MVGPSVALHKKRDLWRLALFRQYLLRFESTQSPCLTLPHIASPRDKDISVFLCSLLSPLCSFNRRYLASPCRPARPHVTKTAAAAISQTRTNQKYPSLFPRPTKSPISAAASLRLTFNPRTLASPKASPREQIRFKTAAESPLICTNSGISLLCLLPLSSKNSTPVKRPYSKATVNRHSLQLSYTE